MVDKNLYQILNQSYTETNLSRITRRIVEAYRTRQNDYLRGLWRRLGTDHGLNASRISRIFAALVSLYHPDRLAFYQQVLREPDASTLQQMEHILITLDYIEQAKPGQLQREVLAEEDPFEYTYEMSEFDSVIDAEQPEQETIDTVHPSAQRDFLSILLQEEPALAENLSSRQYLNSLQGELNLSDCHLEDLNGIEHCINLHSLDLSQNNIGDITDIGYLYQLEELYLSLNRIDSIDALAGLTSLRQLDLSCNEIEDIRVLYDLPALQVVNLVDNPLPADQTGVLRNRGIDVLF